jgi:predicted RNA-binding Zn-ribbon protein involved in translation (DUF1610 family)
MRDCKCGGDMEILIDRSGALFRCPDCNAVEVFDIGD